MLLAVICGMNGSPDFGPEVSRNIMIGIADVVVTFALFNQIR